MPPPTLDKEGIKKIKALCKLGRKLVAEARQRERGENADANAGNPNLDSTSGSAPVGARMMTILDEAESASLQEQQFTQRRIDLAKEKYSITQKNNRAKEQVESIKKKRDEIRQKGGVKGEFKHNRKRYTSESLEKKQGDLEENIATGESALERLSKKMAVITAALPASVKQQRNALNDAYSELHSELHSDLSPLVDAYTEKVESEGFAAAEAAAEAEAKLLKLEAKGEKG